MTVPASYPPPSRRPVPVLYLDIDGTVRRGKDQLGRFVNGPADVQVFPEAVTLMRRWKDAGGRVVGVSNQGGIALGHVSRHAVAAAMAETCRQAEDLIDYLLWCPHHPAATEPEDARCWCRKPAPGLLIVAATRLAETFPEYYPPHLGRMVGDRPEDEQCAAAAGVDFQWAEDWRAAA
ncbi:HAD-IIIA family hydrolase [Actinomadura opuntiae]|uniref:HAD-IIIA family hydrolase n=1 Tax=Actinomadura sp. OS1-43 TaxID=604315 RepID=UPI00255AB366|nr:HAD-IIIA family hydrolase [Actinomadura sp. OS1-43]MDL4812753.1 HAD-IIIA family hydrolase [Actinomadura sp. OS1-43]